MSKHYIFLCFLIFISIENVSSSNVESNKNIYSKTIQFIINFLGQNEEISHVMGYVCWDKAYIMKLIKALSYKGYYSIFNTECNKINMQSKNENRLIYLIDLSCPFTKTCLTVSNETYLFRYPYKWLVLDGFFEETKSLQTDFSNDRLPESGESAFKSAISMETICNTGNPDEIQLDKCPLKFMTRLKLFVDSEMLFARRRPEFANIQLFYIYRQRRAPKFMWDNYGYWNEKEGIKDIRSNPITSMRRLDNKRTPVVSSVVLLNNDSLYHMVYDNEKHIDTVSKMNYMLANHLTDFVNGTPKYSFTPSWGSFRNGTILGMVGDMLRGEVDIGSTPMFIHLDRMAIVEYISMTTRTRAAFVFREPPLSSVSNIFVLPFEWTVWVTVIFFITVSIIVLYFTNTFEDKVYKEMYQKCFMCYKDESQMKTELSEICLIAVGALAQQGTAIEPKSISGKIANLILFFAVMFLYVSYSANIVALLQSESNNIKTLSDLQNSDLTLASDDNIYNRYYIPAFTDPVRKAIWENKMYRKGKGTPFYQMKKGVEMIQKGMFAFHMECGVGYKFVNDLFLEDEKCGLQEITFLDAIYPWFSIPRFSPYREMFKIGMRRIQETGIQMREFLRFYNEKPICSSSAIFLSVGLTDIRPSLIFVGCGFLAAIVVFIIEIIFYYKCKCFNFIFDRRILYD